MFHIPHVDLYVEDVQHLVAVSIIPVIGQIAFYPDFFFFLKG